MENTKEIEVAEDLDDCCGSPLNNWKCNDKAELGSFCFNCAQDIPL